ncbi:hypothetical protein DFJ73DRAFT_769296 [Zopfochytrium polystomum]|nr:hypothetical protein DFJ73DRAFT_769296 [Zopfochytrium polystomum]
MRSAPQLVGGASRRKKSAEIESKKEKGKSKNRHSSKKKQRSKKKQSSKRKQKAEHESHAEAPGLINRGSSRGKQIKKSKKQRRTPKDRVVAPGGAAPSNLDRYAEGRRRKAPPQSKGWRPVRRRPDPKGGAPMRRPSRRAAPRGAAPFRKVAPREAPTQPKGDTARRRPNPKCEKRCCTAPPQRPAPKAPGTRKSVTWQEKRIGRGTQPPLVFLPAMVNRDQAGSDRGPTPPAAAIEGGGVGSGGGRGRCHPPPPKIAKFFLP